MKELSITLIWEGANDASYRFDQFPVLIGRSPDCHLCILHEAVPRELLLAWLENDGRTVRIEERPGLTNKLLKGKDIVNGGLSDGQVEVSVGPLSLRFEPVGDTENKEVRDKSWRSKIVLLSSVGILLFTSTLILGIKRQGNGESPGPQLLPNSPFCQPEQVTCENQNACNERARLYVTRARELLSRPQKRPADRVRAARMLRVAAEIYRETQNPLVNLAKKEALETSTSVEVDYQNDSMVLKRAYKGRGRQSAVAVQAAGRVLEYLDGCRGPWRNWLGPIASLPIDSKDK